MNKINEYVNNKNINVYFLKRIIGVIFYDIDKWSFPFESYKNFISRHEKVPENFDEIAHIIVNELNRRNIPSGERDENIDDIIKDLDIIII